MAPPNYNTCSEPTPNIIEQVDRKKGIKHTLLNNNISLFNSDKAQNQCDSCRGWVDGGYTGLP